MSKIFKKFISIIAALAVVFSFSATAIISAEENDIIISDCSDTGEWSVTAGNQISINQNGYNSDTAVHCQVNYGKLSGKTLNFGPLDASRYSSIEWDAMFYTQTVNGEGSMWEQIVKAYGTNGTNNMFLRLLSANGSYRVYFLSKMKTEISSTNSNWVHFSVDINNYNTENTDNGAFDPTQLTGFYFTTCDGNYTASVNNGFIRMDNIVMTGYIPDDSENIILSECESADNWEYTGNGGVSISTAGKIGSSLYFNTSYGVLRPLVFTPDQGIDVKDHSALEFDFTALNSSTITDQFAYIVENYTDYFTIEISDSNNTHIYKLTDMQITEDMGSWYRIAVPLNEISTVSSVKISTLNAGLGVPDTSIENTIYKIDNLILTKSVAEPNGYDYAKLSDMIINDASSTEGWSYTGSSQNMSVTPNGNTGDALQIFAGNGKMASLTLAFNKPLNISRHTLISWDMKFLKSGTAEDVWEAVKANYTEYINAVITDEMGLSHEYIFSDMNIESIGNGWYRFSIDLTGVNDVDLRNLTSFSFRISDGDYMADLGYNTNIRLDNIYARYIEKIIVKGDINGDGKINIVDMIRFKKYLAEKSVDIVTEASDLNSDSVTDAEDLVCLEQFLLRAIADFSEVSDYQVLNNLNYSPVVKP